MAMSDPFKPKVIHMAKHVNPAGGVSPLCADKPRAIDLNRATWTLVADSVTCPRCRSRMHVPA